MSFAKYAIVAAVAAALIGVPDLPGLLAQDAPVNSQQQQHRQRRRQQESAAVRGRVLDADGSPIPKAAVLIPEFSLSTETDEDGKFEISGIPAGKFHIEVHASGFLPFISDEIDSAESIGDLRVTMYLIPSEEIVITATQTEKMFAETPVKTEVITSTNIERKDASNLATALSLTTGVRVENNCQNCNFTQVRINGMEGKYAQILIDSSPVMTAMTGVYGLEQIPADMLDRVEIVKGAGSALYGGNAVAGVINVITKEPRDNHLDMKIRQNYDEGEPESNIGVHSSYVSPSRNTRVFFFADHQRRAAVDLNGDDVSEIGKLSNTSFGANVYNDFPGLGGKLKFGFFRITEDRRGGDEFSKPPHEAGIAEWIKSDQICFDSRWDHTLSPWAHYTLAASYMDAKRDTYYGSHQDPNAYGKTWNPLFNFSSQIHLQASCHLFSFGLQYRQDKIKDEALGYDRLIDQTYRETGVFFQDEWTPIPGATVLGGVRVNKHSALNKAILTPRASLLVSITGDLGLRVAVSTGFRAPQVFDEDLHITQVGGEGLLIVNAPDLREEKAVSLFAGLDYGHQWGDRLIQLSIEGFRTRVSRQFVMREIASIENARVLERYNGSGSRVLGASVYFGLMTGGGLSFISGWTLQRSRLDEPEPDFGSLRFFRTPAFYGFARLGCPAPVIGEGDVSLDYTGPMFAPHYAGYIAGDRLERTSGFWVVNARIKRSLPGAGQDCSLIIGLFNIFNSYQKDLDLGIDRDSGYVYGPSRPRTVYFGLDLGF
jgi:outer membrane receptor for ferrienterochelin and colicins